jgi:hypothetical protein
MFAVFLTLLQCPVSLCRTQRQLVLENLALRHQTLVLQRQGRRPQLRPMDRWLRIMLKAYWPDWKAAALVFQPETVIGWQRAGFRAFWRWKSCRWGGRPGVDRALVELIRRMWEVNPTWGSPRIRDELAKLGISISASTIRKYRPESRRLLPKAGGPFCRITPGQSRRCTSHRSAACTIATNAWRSEVATLRTGARSPGLVPLCMPPPPRSGWRRPSWPHRYPVSHCLPSPTHQTRSPLPLPAGWRFCQPHGCD